MGGGGISHIKRPGLDVESFRSLKSDFDILDYSVSHDPQRELMRYLLGYSAEKI